MLHLVGYIDAGTGSYLLAAIASGAAGTWFFIRSKFAKLRGRSIDAPTATEAQTTSPDA
jgi:hypothetical protein